MNEKPTNEITVYFPPVALADTKSIVRTSWNWAKARSVSIRGIWLNLHTNVWEVDFYFLPTAAAQTS